MVNDVPMTTMRMPTPAQRALSRADIVGQFEELNGRRCVLAAMEGARYDRRIVGELFTKTEGGVTYPYVMVAWEGDWYRAAFDGVNPPRQPWPAGCVWVEG